jgi:hypothetical protein
MGKRASSMRASVVGGLLVFGAIVAHVSVASASVIVDADASIYDAGNSPLLYGGDAPVEILLPAGTTSVSFSSVTGSITCASAEGCITINGGGNYNDPDGVGAAPSSSSDTGTSTISGITAPNAGYLVGLFVDGTVPTGSAPTSLDFTTGTSFTSLSPILDQTFFIGDGLTGDGTGSVQTFEVPTGATTLYLGISDACNYNGPPSCYSDNDGYYTASYSLASNTPISSVPEPASWTILAGAVLGLLGLSLSARRASLPDSFAATRDFPAA